MSISTDVPVANGPSQEDLADGRRAYELDRQHVFHSWSAQELIHPMTITKAEGSWVWDIDGNRLLDFSSQLVFTNIGHQHPAVVAAVQQQAAKLCTPGVTRCCPRTAPTTVARTSR